MTVEDDDDERWMRPLAIIVLAAMSEGREVKVPAGIGRYMSARLSPILEAEEAAAQGRPGARGAGRMVQAYVDGGMDQVAARKLVAHRMNLKYESAAKAHQLFRKTGEQALLYGEPIFTPR